MACGGVKVNAGVSAGMDKMASGCTIDPEFQALLAHWQAPDWDDAQLAQARLHPAHAPHPAWPSPRHAILGSEQFIHGPEGAPMVRLLIHQPLGGAGTRGHPVILHLHGGGFVLGGPDMLAARNDLLADALGAVVVSVDYRLAPHHIFPAALDDIYEALAWLVDQAEALAIDPSRIAVLGENAGGTLAAALALRVRARGEYLLAGQFLIAPLLNPLLQVESGGLHVWTGQRNHYAWQAYLGGQMVPPWPAEAVPFAAEDLSGLAPFYLAAGGCDILAADVAAFAARLKAAGVAAALHIYPGGVHGFEALLPHARLAQAAHQALVTGLKSVFSDS